MGTFRDWPKTLRPASYRGAHFYVDSDEIETGRRLEVHEFPHADAPYVEDLGRKANTISVTAYVVSDAADREAAALHRACGAGGAALLSLPIERLQAHCESCRRTFSKDRLGYIAFSLSFVRDGLGAGPVPLGFLSSMVTAVIGSFRSQSIGAFERSYSALRVPGWVADSAIAEVRAVAGLAAGLLSGAPFIASKTAGLQLAASTLYANASSLARSGAAGHVTSPTSFVAAAEIVSPAPLAAALFDLGRGLGSATAGEALETLAPLLDYNSDIEPDAALGWRRAEQDNSAAIGRIVRVAALAGFAERVAQTRYEDRRAAIQARADVAELTGIELQRLAGGRDHAVIKGLSVIAGRTGEYLSRQIADLAPVLIIEAPRRMPSLYWAQRLYGTAERAGELARLNRVRHPAFMPATFEAKSR